MKEDLNMKFYAENVSQQLEMFRRPYESFKRVVDASLKSKF